MHQLQTESEEGIMVTLEPDEVLVCEQLGRMRSLIARTSNVNDAKMGNQDGMVADVMGMKGEYAFAKAFNTFPDLGLTPRSGGADGRVHGYAYDVKTTNYKNGKLLATKKINPDIDLYVLAVILSPQIIDIKGYLMKSQFIREGNLCDLGHGEGYCADQSQLHKFKKI
jgi:hypothetical protein